MKRFLLAATLVILAAALAGCGGGAGTSSQPSGVNAGVASVIQVMPVQSIAQTNSYISVKARVLDGNGVYIPNVKVTFTNLSLIGSLSSTSATTNQEGIATVNLYSTTAGFATVQAEVASASGQIRDKKTVFFSDYDLFFSTPTPQLALDVDGNNNNIWNEPSDYQLFETPDDNEVLVRATLTLGGVPVPDSLIIFAADTAEGSFPISNMAVTNNDGQAIVLVKVDPIALRNFNTVLNVMAVADDGAANIVSLFLNPVTVNTVSVSAESTTVNSGETTTISALVSTTAGNNAPDGTAVDFTTANGNVTAFGQTTDGVATATYTAPTLDAGSANQTATVTASSGGKSGSITITIVAPPATPTPAPTPDFTLTCTPAVVDSSSSHTSTCTLTALNGFNSPVALNCDPAAPTTGGSCAFAPPAVAPTASGVDSILTYTCGSAGTGSFDVVATSGSVTHNFTMAVTCP